MTMRITANEAAKIFISDRLQAWSDSMSHEEYKESGCGLDDASDAEVEAFHLHLRKHTKSITKRLKGRELNSKLLKAYA